ncbi:hypothetical protein Vafri_10293 [Volvox africanus]|uniref:Uncharacterized protein n=1 Tax=Volvox africanus TaxID=51714 RepID=A0A8J4F0I8_9CHLO|nr:hypothetical protein Vafri_10293 [Volvox africanus]
MQTQLSARAGTIAPSRASRGSRCVLRTQALFGFGKSKNEVDSEKDEQWRLQQELIQKRKSGQLIKEANERRKKVSEELASRKDLRRREKEALARGEMPDTLRGWKPYDKEIDEKANSGIVVPLLPFGIKKYDDVRVAGLLASWRDEWLGSKESMRLCLRAFLVSFCAYACVCLRLYICMWLAANHNRANL